MCTNSARLVNSLECYMDELVECFEDFVKKSLFIISIAVGALIVMLGYVLKVVNERTQNLQGGMPRPELTVGVMGAHNPETARLSMSSMPSDYLQAIRNGQKPLNSAAMPVYRNEGKKAVSAAANTAMPSAVANTAKLSAVAKTAKLSAAANTATPSRELSFDERVMKSEPSFYERAMKSEPSFDERAMKSEPSFDERAMKSEPSFDERVLKNIGLSSCSKSCMQSKRSIMRNCSSSRIAIPSMSACFPNHHLATPRPCSKIISNRNSCCSMCCADDQR